MKTRWLFLLIGFVALLVIGVAVLAQEATPTSPLTGTITYTVKSGDVLDLIAAQYDVDVACLITMNNLPKSGEIFPGDTLTISDQCPRYYGSSPVQNPRPTANTPGIYIVQPGDVFDLIAKSLNVSAVALKIANDLPNGFLIYPGQRLTIPANAPPFGSYPAIKFAAQGNGTPYIVQPGDVLDLIAAYFNVDLQCLMKRNNITFPLTPGLVLLIPPDCPKYSGLSTPRPGEIRGLGLEAVIVTPAATENLSAATLIAPTATLMMPTATLPPPTATVIVVTVTPTLPPASPTLPAASPTNTITPGGPTLRPSTVTPTPTAGG